jgi:hypothetical protein
MSYFLLWIFVVNRRMEVTRFFFRDVIREMICDIIFIHSQSAFNNWLIHQWYPVILNIRNIRSQLLLWCCLIADFIISIPMNSSIVKWRPGFIAAKLKCVLVKNIIDILTFIWLPLRYHIRHGILWLVLLDYITLLRNKIVHYLEIAQLCALSLETWN